MSLTGGGGLALRERMVEVEERRRFVRVVIVGAMLTATASTSRWTQAGEQSS